MTTTDTHGRDQAQAQLESIIEMVRDLDDPDRQEQAQERIQEDPLEVSVRSGWHPPGKPEPPSEYTILLCTGGPACRVIGDLSEHGEPSSARIEFQDWFEPWTDYPLNSEQAEAVLAYARQFYFGE